MIKHNYSETIFQSVNSTALDGKNTLLQPNTLLMLLYWYLLLKSKDYSDLSCWSEEISFKVANIWFLMSVVNLSTDSEFSGMSVVSTGGKTISND